MGLLPGRVNGRTEDSAEGILCSIWHGTGIPCSHIGSSCDIEMDVRILFTILMVAAAASGFFMLYRNQNNTREIKRAEVNMNHAITLLNHTKIKYVNSTNAVDYACEKYHVHNSYELTYLWEQYLEAKREREKF